MAFMWILGIVVYLAIGGIIHAIVPDEDDELAGIIIAWPLFVAFLIIIGTFLAFKAFGCFIVTALKHFFYTFEEGEEQNET